MTEQAAQAAATAAQAPGHTPAVQDPAAQALNAAPVVLDFELGRLSLTLAELAALQPGHVFPLGGRLEDARIAIRANGVRVGHGELVAVGDVLGVQLLAIAPDGPGPDGLR